MSRLYIANCTKQNQTVYYRLDFNNRGEPEKNTRFQPAKQQEIPPGRQIILGGDFHPTQIEDIVQQLVPYGLIGVTDVPRQKVVAPFVFNVDRPVPADIMRNISAVNSAVQIEQGKMRRQKAAIAVNDLVSQRVAQEFLNQGITDEPTQDISLAIEQEDQSEAGEKMIAEGFKVDANAKAAPGKGPRRRKN